MLRSYLKTALRNLIRSKVYSILNIAGLAIGVACFALISSYAYYQMSFDRYDKRASDIYRLTYETRIRPGMPDIDYARVQSRFARLLQSEFPAISDYVRIAPLFDAYVAHGNQRFIDKGVFLSDPALFNVFSFHFIRGNERTALADPRSVVITKKISDKCFGPRNPLGEILTLDFDGQHQDFKVAGVMDDVPSNSHFTFDMLIPFQKIDDMGGDSSWCYTYLLLHHGESPSSLEAALPAFVNTHVSGNSSADFRFMLQPLTDIHLKSHMRFEIQPNGDIENVYVFSVIAFLILLVACANFTNLTISQYLNRTKEAGIRKVAGAPRSSLIMQFITESTLTVVIATVFGLAGAELLLPVFTRLTGSDLNLSPFIKIDVLFFVFPIALLGGIAAGIYPAFYLSSFRPADILRQTGATGSSKMSLRKGLVIFQFIISISLVIGTIVIDRQFQFMRNKDLGFDKDAVIVLPNPFGDHYQVFKNNLMESSDIVAVTAASYVPGQVPGDALVRATLSGQNHQMKWISVDQDFLRTLKMNLVSGETFSQKLPSNFRGFMINQEAAKELRWSAPVGKTLIAGLDTGRVIGVVHDIYYSSLRRRIDPIVFWYHPTQFWNILVRVRPGDYASVLSRIRSQWGILAPDIPFEYHLLDQDLDNLYKSEERLGSMLAAFASLAILVACLGLFAFAAFVTEQKTKEIGIRKVLGASVSEIVFLLSKEFAKWVLIANVIAWPLIYYIMNKWLENFAYRTSIGIWVFVISGVAALLIAMLTVGSRAIKAATANPVKSLRYE